MKAGGLLGAIVGVVVPVAACSMPAFAADGLYAGLGAGGAHAIGQDVTLTVPGQGTAQGNVSLHTGFAGTAAAGYAFHNGLRPEAEFGFRRNVNGDIGLAENATTYMGNLWYDLWQDGYFVYAGGGLGAAQVHVNISGHTGSDTQFAWQAGGGFGGAVARRLVLSFDYRYLSTASDASVNIEGANFKAGYRTNVYGIALRYYFG